MKVAVSATGHTPTSLVHPQFGRCEWFLIFENEKNNIITMRNQYAEVQTGAGIGCAQDLIGKGIEAIISGQYGPKAYEVLRQAGVGIYLAPPTISAQEAYERFLSKNLQEMEIRRF